MFFPKLGVNHSENFILYLKFHKTEQFPNVERIKERQNLFMKIKFSRTHFGILTTNLTQESRGYFVSF